MSGHEKPDDMGCGFFILLILLAMLSFAATRIENKIDALTERSKATGEAK